MKRYYLLLLGALVGATMVYKSVITFDHLVTDKVIGETVTKIINGDREISCYGAIRDASMAARHAVYHRQFGEGWFDEVYASIAVFDNGVIDSSHWDTYWLERDGSKKTYRRYQKILNLCRKALKSPSLLQIAYMKKREKVIEEIKRQGATKKFQVMIDQALPYFEGTAPAANDSGYYAPTLNREWVERRRAEGGQPLVDMWAWCLHDLRQSL